MVLVWEGRRRGAYRALKLQIDENKVHDQETVEIQDPEKVNVKKPSSAKDPRKQLKITSFFK